MRLSICIQGAPAGIARAAAAVSAAGAAGAAAVTAPRSRISASRAAGRKPARSVECAATMTENDSTAAAPGARSWPAESAPRATAPLIDIGINLAHDSYDADRSAVIARAAAAGVVQMIVTGSSAASSHQGVALSRQHPGRLFATAGVHPHHAAELSATVLTELGELTLEPEV